MKKEKASASKKIPKKLIISEIVKALKSHQEISFAYLHGSFAKGNNFKDIDIALYLKSLPSSLLDYELKMETELSAVTGGYIVDVRILNVSPLSFRYNVVKDGLILFAQDDDERSNFQEITMSMYFDFEPYRKLYLREALNVGI
jgi:predicted nucleotidyltransferase